MDCFEYSSDNYVEAHAVKLKWTVNLNDLIYLKSVWVTLIEKSYVNQAEKTRSRSILAYKNGRPTNIMDDDDGSILVASKQRRTDNNGNNHVAHNNGNNHVAFKKKAQGNNPWTPTGLVIQACGKKGHE